jgi:NAD(P)-dependent dehydrogenase (short-subunit alcohol dehydrogenase family)
MKSFHNKVAAITGAGSGIGRALAINLAGRGCHLAVSDINPQTLAETVELAQVASTGSAVRITSTVVDVSDRQAVHQWADQTAAEFGKIHLIFNNAGVALAASVQGMEYEDLEWLMGINFWGVVHGTKAFLPYLVQAGEGHVINISSVFGLAGIPSQSAYNAAKFAVRGYTDSLRQELEMMNCGVSATVVHPGGIKTNIARAARQHDSIRQLGIELDEGGKKFERSFRTTPEQAAQTILRAVEKNRRRVLVGTDAVIFDWITRTIPAHYQRLTVWFTRRNGKEM